MQYEYSIDTLLLRGGSQQVQQPRRGVCAHAGKSGVHNCRWRKTPGAPAPARSPFRGWHRCPTCNLGLHALVRRAVRILRNSWKLRAWHVAADVVRQADDVFIASDAGSGAHAGDAVQRARDPGTVLRAEKLFSGAGHRVLVPPACRWSSASTDTQECDKGVSRACCRRLH